MFKVEKYFDSKKTKEQLRKADTFVITKLADTLVIAKLADTSVIAKLQKYQ